jgi:hypothetical protein
VSVLVAGTFPAHRAAMLICGVLALHPFIFKVANVGILSCRLIKSKANG